MSGNADVEAKIIDAIYRGACDAAELVRAIELIAAYFASPAAILAEIDQLQPECRLGIGVGVVDAQEFVRYGQYAHLDPMPRALAALPAGTVATSNHIIPNGERRSVFINEYLLPLGAKEALGCPLLSNNGRFALLSVLQGINRESYDAGDIARLERLTPHLTRALQIRRLFLQSEARGKTLESIVDRNETAMIGLPRDGPALFVNGAARAVAAAQDGLGLDRRRAGGVADREAAISASPRLPPMSRAAAPAGWCGFRGRRAARPMWCWCPRCRRATTYFRIPTAGSCSPFTTPPAARRRPSSGSRNCCIFRSAPPRWCKRSSRAPTSRTMRIAPASR